MNKLSAERQPEKLTWKKLKELIESAGVNDTDVIDDIDVSWGEIAEFKCFKDEVFGWKIRL